MLFFTRRKEMRTQEDLITSFDDNYIQYNIIFLSTIFNDWKFSVHALSCFK